MDTNNDNTIYRESSQPSEEQQHQYNSNKTGSGQGYPSSGNKSNKTMIIMLAVIAVLLAAIAAILLFKNSGEKEEPQKDEVVKKAKKAKQKPTDRTITVNGVSFKMVYVKGGTFQMGTSGGEFPRESPAHSVTVSDFYIGETEVTQELWEAVMEYNPSSFSGSRLPVENIDYDDCQEFIEKLNELTGEAFRLPYEAEWEFASRGGTKSEGYNYSGSNAIGDVAWYNANSGSQSHEVGTKKANELGIFDMSGNVWEWCEDFFDDNYYSVSPEQDPTGPESGDSWLNRGGSWKSGAKYCRSAYRGQGKNGERESYLGMRLAIGTKAAPAKRRRASAEASSSSDTGNHLAVINVSNIILPPEISDAVTIVPQSGGNVYCDFNRVDFPEVGITFKLLKKVNTASMVNEYNQMWIVGFAMDGEGRDINELNPEDTAREWRTDDSDGKEFKKFLEGNIGSTITMNFTGESNFEALESDQSIIEAGKNRTRNAAKNFKKFRLKIKNGAAVEVESLDEDDGLYLEGKMGGWATVMSFSLENGTGDLSYAYGSSSFGSGEEVYRTLSLQQYDPRSGKLVINVYNNDEQRTTGRLDGKLKNGVYSGRFVNVNGSSSSFSFR